MKVKYWKSKNVLTCSNESFKLNLGITISKSNNETLILYDPSNIIEFIDSEFLPSTVSTSKDEFEKMYNAFLYSGSNIKVDGKVLVTLCELKHFFSSFIGYKRSKNQDVKDFGITCSKFISWFLKYDFDNAILKALNLIQVADDTCTFCQTIVNNSKSVGTSMSSVCVDKIHSREEFLLRLAVVAGREFRQLVIKDNIESQKNSHSSSLACYDPHEDWESTSSVIKTFINELLFENNSDIFKVTFRNCIFNGNHPKKYRRKPQSCYFTSAIIKYANNNKKILDFLAAIGIGVTDDALNNLEKNQITDFNTKFWTIPSSATVMSVMDNNQADFGTKYFNPLQDKHHVDCLNVLQVVKPSGNSELMKESRSIQHVDTNFIKTNCFEQSAGSYFLGCFNAHLLSIIDIQSVDSLKQPVIQDIIPVGESSSDLVDDITVKFVKEDGNVLKSRLLLGPKYAPFNQTDPYDTSISWDNKQGSKTSLRYLKIGKSTDDHVFMDCLNFLFTTFKTKDRAKIFVTLDQALHCKFKSLISKGKMPREYIDFFIVVLDPFHHQWCLLKCIYSAFEDAGLKDLVCILGIDSQKWPNLLGESRNVHKAQSILQDITTALGIFFVNYFTGTLTEEEKIDLSSKGITERAIWLQSCMPSFLERLSKEDQTMSVYVEFYSFAILVIQCWESQRTSNYDMYIHSIKETLPYLFSFNRFNYQQSAVEFLLDISMLGDYYVDLLRSGVMFEALSSEQGKEVSCGYVLEIYNRFIKELSTSIDSTGNAWKRNLPRLSFTRQILLNGAKAKIFSESESDPISKKIVNITNVSKLRWVIEKRNIFEVDLIGYTIKHREAFHIFNNSKIQQSFVSCKIIGQRALNELVSKVVDNRVIGSIDFLRKQLNLKKIHPIEGKKKIGVRSIIPLSKPEKLALTSHYSQEDIPKVSFMMLSPDNGNTPYMASNKSNSGKFIIDQYAAQLQQESVSVDLIVVDLMPLIFSQPPSSVYSAPSPLNAYCTWFVESFIAPYIRSASKVVLCIDRKELERIFPLKTEAHKKRNSRGDTNDFGKILSFLLNKPLNIVSGSYIPPFSWFSSNRNVRFELIFRVFEEIFKNPDKFPFPDIDFELYVDGFYDEGKDLHSKILNKVGSSFIVTDSTFTVNLPEADQAIFFILKHLNFSKCLIKYKDNDILLSALMNFEQICWQKYPFCQV